MGPGGLARTPQRPQEFRSFVRVTVLSTGRYAQSDLLGEEGPRVVYLPPRIGQANCSMAGSRLARDWNAEQVFSSDSPAASQSTTQM